MNGFIDESIKKAIEESGLPKEKVEEVTSMMVQYLNTGAKYGQTPEGFLKWYVKDMGGKLT